MAMRIIEVIVSKDDVDKVLRVARGPDVADVWCIPGAEPGQMVVRVLAPMTHCQELIDKFHGILMDNRHHIVLIPTLAVIPEPEDASEAPPEQAKPSTAAREELYNTVAEGTKVDTPSCCSSCSRPWLPASDWWRTTSPWSSAPW